MLRIRLDDNYECVPEISANKYALNVRFTTAIGTQRRTSVEDVSFSLHSVIFDADRPSGTAQDLLSAVPCPDAMEHRKIPTGLFCSERCKLIDFGQWATGPIEFHRKSGTTEKRRTKTPRSIPVPRHLEPLLHHAPRNGAL
jgi:endogenous inhibitor of DNA gyrase (YacG/DUF329 family)